jgi:hypothetical protein
VRLGDGRGDGQAKPGAVAAGLLPGSEPLEGLQQPADLAGRDDLVVGDHDDGRPVGVELFEQGDERCAATAREPVAVLGAAAAAYLGIDRIWPGERIWAGNMWFYLAGILRSPWPVAPPV